MWQSLGAQIIAAATRPQTSICRIRGGPWRPFCDFVCVSSFISFYDPPSLACQRSHFLSHTLLERYDHTASRFGLSGLSRHHTGPSYVPLRSLRDLTRVASVRIKPQNFPTLYRIQELCAEKARGKSCWVFGNSSVWLQMVEMRHRESAREAKEGEDACVLCHTRPRSHLFVPCGHFLLCGVCSPTIRCRHLVSLLLFVAFQGRVRKVFGVRRSCRQGRYASPCVTLTSFNCCLKCTSEL